MPELNFKGKEFVYNHHLAVPFRPLEPDAAKSSGGTALDGNLIIHGDNLHALKALLPMYAGKVDCVFIDPPYNTGNEGWCYNDNVNSPMIREWLNDNPVGIEDGLRHDKWCAMMWPRLRLLHELLSEDGSFWMTLDDNEAHRGKLMLDAIFGQDGFVANIVWQKKYAVANDHTGIAPMHDHLLVYAKRAWERNKLERPSEKDSPYRYSDQHGIFRIDNYTCNKTADERPNLYYKVKNPNTGRSAFPSRTHVWRYSREQHEKNEEAGLVWWGADGKSELPSYKRYRHALRDGGKVVPGTWWEWTFAGHTDAAKKELMEILPELGSDLASMTPKPSQLLARILEVAVGPEALVLDSFAGSGTTAHAVLAANKRDSGNRKFILVECESYADKLTAERVRRLIKGYKFEGTRREELFRKKLTWTELKRAEAILDEIAGIENLEGKRFDSISKKVDKGVLVVTGEKKITQRTKGLGGAFTYCTLGEPLELDRLLTGETLPSFEALGAVLFHMASNEAFDAAKLSVKDGLGYLGASSACHMWLIYKPDLEFLKSVEAALTLKLAESLVKKKKDGKRHLIFAPARFVSQKMLNEAGLPVEFAPLPFALYRVERR